MQNEVVDISYEKLVTEIIAFQFNIVVILIVNILFRFTHKYSLQYLFPLTLFMATGMEIRSSEGFTFLIWLS